MAEERMVERYNFKFLRTLPRKNLNILAKIERLKGRSKIEEYEKMESLLLVPPSDLGKRYISGVRFHGNRRILAEQRTEPRNDHLTIERLQNARYERLAFPEDGMSTKSIEEKIENNEYVPQRDLLAYRNLQRTLPLGDGGIREDRGRYIIYVPDRYIPTEMDLEGMRLRQEERQRERRRRRRIRRGNEGAAHQDVPPRQRQPEQQIQQRQPVRQRQIISRGEGAEECPICLLGGAGFLKLPCSHELHLSCAREWCQANSNNRCPICRADISVRELQIFTNEETAVVVLEAENLLEGIEGCEAEMLNMMIQTLKNSLKNEVQSRIIWSTSVSLYNYANLLKLHARLLTGQ